ncbi:fatty acyl-AMP ligase [Kitasatospora sp. NPDC058965]|uniref:fatty acyl-AMP ligase n=1 Tax=Kitasatospora sp. NPDC058965 TaxID=3346682 RepID=UPI0036BC2684
MALSPTAPPGAHLAHWAAERGSHRAFTHVDFSAPGGVGRHHSVSWQQLADRVGLLAGRLREAAAPGDRVALLLPQGLDYVTGFLGCLTAGVVAVPLFSPDLPGHADRLAAVLADAEPSCVLTDGATASAVADFLARHGIAPGALLQVDRTGSGRPADPVAFADPAPEETAYLQYTSGSTRSPSGVMVSHGNLAANARQALRAFDLHAARTTAVSWLPLFHDMGLVLGVAAPLIGGFPSVLMDPVAFLEEPARWLRLLAGYPGTISAAPNFAYDYSAARVDPQEAAGLRLDRVQLLINGSEPVRAGTLERFRAAFAPAGLGDAALCPSYGLAEATVLVTAHPKDEPPQVLHVAAADLAAGELTCRPEPGPGLVPLVDCGPPAGQQVLITDPGTGRELPAGRVGEIRVQGPNIGAGYWKQASRTDELFAAGVPGRPGPWLRTGDLGALLRGRLVVTGRLKDLLVLDGRNHYPQDLEETVQAELDCVRRDRLAVVAAAGPGAVVAVAEVGRGVRIDAPLRAGAERTARALLSARHGVRLERLVLVPAGTVPRTSSGKISRSACRERLLAGDYDEVAADV